MKVIAQKTARSKTTEESGTSAPEESQVRHRLQFDFSPDAYKRLIGIRQRADVRTNAELVRNALSLYEWYLNNKDYKIHLVKGDEVKQVEIVF